jgi:hypothetical protein
MKKTIMMLLSGFLYYSCSNIVELPSKASKSDVINKSERGISTPNGRSTTRPVLPAPSPPFTAQDLYLGVFAGTAAISPSNGSGYFFREWQPDNIVMTSTGGLFYSVIAGRYGVTGSQSNLPTLYKFNPWTGTNTDLSSPYGTTWDNTDALTAWNGWLYAIQGGTLWRIETNLGQRNMFSQYPQGWAGTEAMAALDNFLYAIQGGTLYRVNIGNGSVSSFSQYPSGWGGTEGMAATNGGVFIVQGGTLWRVSTSNGSVAPFSAFPTGWEGTLAMTAKNGIVYIAQGSSLWTVNTFNGSVAQLGTNDWSSTTAMTARN